MDLIHQLATIIAVQFTIINQRPFSFLTAMSISANSYDADISCTTLINFFIANKMKPITIPTWLSSNR